MAISRMNNGDMVDFERLASANVTQTPFPFAIVPNFVSSDAREAFEADFPRISHAGSFPLASLSCGPAFRTLIDTLSGAEMTALVGKKLGIDLAGRPVMVTVRGHCAGRDGEIHTDSKTKLVTMLLYTNKAWECASARLRLLRSSSDLEDFAAEVPPEEYTLVIFKNGPNAWHGFAPFHGERRVIQVNWVTDGRVVAREQARHRLSAFVKRLFGNPLRSKARTHASAH
jgi:SM-20-related protein